MHKILEFIEKTPKIFKNKYIITIVLFFIWILFVDDYNILKQYQLQKDVDKLEDQKSYYINEIRNDSIEKYNLQNTKEAQEKFAREKFLMKKDNEDVFIIRNKKNE
tara:strand:- start:304 stop:621 length:318 start_codon:yes stop_codon:yes gene_type:complete